jgi:hypothetical protein
MRKYIRTVYRLKHYKEPTLYNWEPDSWALITCLTPDNGGSCDDIPLKHCKAGRAREWK